jgi:hypothetical protein
MTARPFCVAAALVLLAGCASGGGPPGGSPLGAQGLLPQGKPAETASTAVTRERATVRLVITVPHRKTAPRRNPHYISPSTAALKYQIAGRPAVTVSLAPSNRNSCTRIAASGLQCVVALSAPPGDDAFTFTALDASGNALSANRVTRQIVVGTVNQIALTLGGIAASIEVTPPSSADVSGSQAGGFSFYGNHALQFGIVLRDVDGNVIVGPGTPQLVVKSTPANVTIGAPSSSTGTWTLTSTYHASTPSTTASSTLSISAAPVPGSGGSTIRTTVPLTLYGVKPWANAARLTISFHLPASPSSSRRHPHYVSPSTSQVTVVVNTVNGGSAPSWVPSSTTTTLTVGTNCTLSDGTETCSVEVPAPPGSVNYTFTTSDGTNALSTLTTTQTVVQGTSNSFDGVLQGIVHKASFSVGTLAVQSTSGAYPQTATVDAYDADGNLIVDPGAYANSFTLTDPETSTSGMTKLSVNSGTASGSVTVSSPDDVVVLDNLGGAVNSFAIGVGGSIPGGGTVACSSGSACNVTAATPNDVTFTGTTLDNTANGGLNTDANWGQQTVFFAQTSGSQTLTGAEVGFTGGFSGKFDIALDSTTCGTGGSAVATVSAGPATSFTITAANVGICKVQLTEAGSGYPLTTPGHTANVAGSATHDGTFWISVTSSSIGVSGRHHPK